MNFKFAAISLVLILAFACGEDPIVPPPTNGPQQYGTPLVNVPDPDKACIYEVNLRAQSSEGTLQGVISKLQHIKSLGTNIIWLMPIYEEGSVNSVGSPYCVKDYTKINPEYGTLADLRALTDQAHALEVAHDEVIRTRGEHQPRRASGHPHLEIVGRRQHHQVHEPGRDHHAHLSAFVLAEADGLDGDRRVVDRHALHIECGLPVGIRELLYCVVRALGHFAEALTLVTMLGMTATSVAAWASEANPVVHQLETVVVTGKAQTLHKLPTVIVVGKRQAVS